eukprot:CAMPEP_0198211248 /NCGR_PEP_ID=MMETSP1445-20131203/22848_1 /TAXON_ID=36898 /ORGANISM="Pyramimonas sp., Strain CCMP2087" /LENGTH=42 /DNA_ID= /DNA_START= /DNA_END= /DNA_ORIENTATION=
MRKACEEDGPEDDAQDAGYEKLGVEVTIIVHDHVRRDDLDGV